jgi:putative transposase
MSGTLPRRPPRLELFQNIRPFYFVTFNTRNRSRVLDNGPVHETFTAFCKRAHGEHDVAVGRYVLMPDHVHLFVALPDTGIRLTRWIQSLKNVLGKSLNALGQAHPYWQEGFFDHVLRSGESYSEKWEYVRQNPVRAGLCKSPDQWPWQGEIVRIEY